ncbi:hypothetical protein [Pseudomaricurvus sp.]|uniref:hypothetical protein n=1 Tax=Pseudomaricurvus sp. TaxID=2004510 RepID=UPI003F6AA352
MIRIRTPRAHPFLLAILLACGGYSSTSFAQTETKTADTQKTEQETAKKDNTASTEKTSQNTSRQNRTTSSSADFTPSEEVSEDLSVSFPVDI